MRVLARISLALLVMAIACTGDASEKKQLNRPVRLKPDDFAESELGDPAVVGCADGQREAFADVARHPWIAGCYGQWRGDKNLRADPTGNACGDDLPDAAFCFTPADVCAPGWHVCGHDGKRADLRERTTALACNEAGPGRFNAAMSHAVDDKLKPCTVILKHTELDCRERGYGTEPVCCGADCVSPRCRDAVWRGKTRISPGPAEGCGKVRADTNGGVLCCIDTVPSKSATPPR